MFVDINQLPNMVEIVATLALVVYFAIAIAIYMIHGYLGDTDNQLREINAVTRWFMWTLIAAEIGGFLILFYGVLVAL
tara:strand:- start:1777 stop:2010 length:234 start_codon:yes stop_codon:yes gene_type:complete